MLFIEKCALAMLTTLPYCFFVSTDTCNDILKHFAYLKEKKELYAELEALSVIFFNKEN